MPRTKITNMTKMCPDIFGGEVSFIIVNAFVEVRLMKLQQHNNPSWCR